MINFINFESIWIYECTDWIFLCRRKMTICLLLIKSTTHFVWGVNTATFTVIFWYNTSFYYLNFFTIVFIWDNSHPYALLEHMNVINGEPPLGTPSISQSRAALALIVQAVHILQRQLFKCNITFLQSYPKLAVCWVSWELDS